MTVTSKRIVITVDGLAATGKSTLAKLLAEKIGFKAFNSGEIYRAFAYGFANTKKEFSLSSVTEYLPHCSIALLEDGSLTIDNRIITEEEREHLRSHSISDLTSKLAAIPEVRKKLFTMQREAFGASNIVAEGRDMGTVVFPEATVKFFITASPEVQAARRQLQQPQLDIPGLNRELKERNQRDCERQVAPTLPASDALVIENNYSEPHTVLKEMAEIVQRKLYP